MAGEAPPETVAQHTGATVGDAIIAFLPHFEAHPFLYIILLVVLGATAFALCRLATYLLPKDLAGMLDKFNAGWKSREAPLLDEIKRLGGGEKDD